MVEAKEFIHVIKEFDIQAILREANQEIDTLLKCAQEVPLVKEVP